MKSLGLFGERVLHPPDSEMIQLLMRVINQSKEKGYGYAMIVAERGFSLSAAWACCECQLPYKLIVPYIGHDEEWKPEEKSIFAKTIDRAWKVEATGGQEHQSHVVIARKHVINHCDLVVTDHQVSYNVHALRYCITVGRNAISIRDGVVRKLTPAPTQIAIADDALESQKIDEIAYVPPHKRKIVSPLKQHTVKHSVFFSEDQ